MSVAPVEISLVLQSVSYLLIRARRVLSFFTPNLLKVTCWWTLLDIVIEASWNRMGSVKQKHRAQHCSFYFVIQSLRPSSEEWDVTGKVCVSCNLMFCHVHLLPDKAIYPWWCSSWNTAQTHLWSTARAAAAFIWPLSSATPPSWPILSPKDR